MAGTNYFVYTTDAANEGYNTHCPDSSDDWCKLTVDAIKFVRQGTNYLPHINY